MVAVVTVAIPDWLSYWKLLILTAVPVSCGNTCVVPLPIGQIIWIFSKLINCPVPSWLNPLVVTVAKPVILLYSKLAILLNEPWGLGNLSLVTPVLTLPPLTYVCTIVEIPVFVTKVLASITLVTPKKNPVPPSGYVFIPEVHVKAIPDSFTFSPVVSPWPTAVIVVTPVVLV